MECAAPQNRHPRLALFVVLSVVVGGRVGLNEVERSSAGSGESKRGDTIAEAAHFPDRSGEQVLIQGKGAMASSDPQVTAAVEDVVDRLAAIPGVTDIESPLDPEDRVDTVSNDGRSVAVNFKLSGADEEAEKLVERPLAAVAAVQKAHSGERLGAPRLAGVIAVLGGVALISVSAGA
jgi:hypothetical protein